MILAAWYHPVLATLFAFVSIVLMGVILLQRGKGVGLAGAFGGAGGHTAFGAKTGDFLTWATIVVAGVLLFYSVVLNFVFRPPTVGAAPAVVQQPVSSEIPTGDEGALPLDLPSSADESSADLPTGAPTPDAGAPGDPAPAKGNSSSPPKEPGDVP